MDHYVKFLTLRPIKLIVVLKEHRIRQIQYPVVNALKMGWQHYFMDGIVMSKTKFFARVLNFIYITKIVSLAMKTIVKDVKMQQLAGLNVENVNKQFRMVSLKIRITNILVFLRRSYLYWLHIGKLQCRQVL